MSRLRQNNGSCQSARSWKRRRTRTEDTFSRQDADHRIRDTSEQVVEFPWVLAQNNEFDADAVPFPPRFLLHEIVFATRLLANC